MQNISLSVNKLGFNEFWQHKEFEVTDKQGKAITTVATKNDGETIYEIEQSHPNLTSFFASFVTYHNKAEQCKALKQQALNMIKEQVASGTEDFTITLKI